ncbi:MAG: glycosyl hydrolase family 95 catalytic domain-containing protein, partial [Trebonia sp.]
MTDNGSGKRNVSRRTALKAAGGLAAAGAAGIFGPGTARAAAFGPKDGAPSAGTNSGLVLWYHDPAQNWQGYLYNPLPIGNGALGAMVFGGVGQEHVQFNEHTLWTGGPGSAQGGQPYNFGNWYSPRPGALETVRTTIQGELSETARPDDSATWGASLLCQDADGYGAYQAFGDAYITLTSPPSAYTAYRRQLDLNTGITTTTYAADGVTYQREFLASYPDGVIAGQLTASAPAAQSFTVSVAPPGSGPATVTSAGGRITLRGSLSDNGMNYESQLQVLADGAQAKVTSNADGSVTVATADSVVLVLAAGTDYAASYPDYRGADPHPRVTAALDAAAGRPFPALRGRHLDDYQELFGRVSLRIPQVPGGVDPSLDIDDQMNLLDQAMTDEAANEDVITALNRNLEPLLFQFGRYLLISSSRSGSLPVNLQGVWNNVTDPPWNSDYTTNINLEMNYWSAEVTNLAETTAPLFDFIEGLRGPGRVTAREMFGASGWTAMNHLNPFGYTGVQPSPTEWSPESTGWLLHSMWRYYRYTGDREFLATRAYPAMREATEFWLDYLITDPADGKLVVSPSYSPEHGPYTPACSYSQMVVWDLLSNTIEASEELGTDAAYRARLQSTLDNLDPGLRIGTWGQLQEWKVSSWDDPNSNHRHISHLYGVFPGRQITPSTPDLFDAATVSLNVRTVNDSENGIGWRLALRANLWAGLRNGDTALAEVDHQIWRNILGNMLNNDPFQIDGNLGSTAAMARMLIQDTDGATDILPALPAQWASQGSFTGLRGHGGFEYDVAWSDGVPTLIRVRSGSGGTARISSPPLTARPLTVTAARRPVPHEVTGGTLILPTTDGQAYEI